MTHTPASGPKRLVTTPPMSSASISMPRAGCAGAWFCCARTAAGAASTATAITAAFQIPFPIFIPSPPCVDFRGVRRIVDEIRREECTHAADPEISPFTSELDRPRCRDRVLHARVSEHLEGELARLCGAQIAEQR